MPIARIKNALVGKVKEAFIRRAQRPGQSTGVSKLRDEDFRHIEAMFEELAKGEVGAQPSKYWIELNKMHLNQLRTHGYEPFKRTLGLAYFTWVRIMPWDSQFRFLIAALPG